MREEKPTYHAGVAFYEATEAALHDDADTSSGGGGICCRDLATVKKQRGVIGGMIREVGKRLLKGSISLNDMSMPVKIFEPRSYLEKLADPWIYPEFLDRAALANDDPVERMRWTMTFFVAGMQHVFHSWAKPFNPILGETYQADLPDGSHIDIEQLSHHPPVCCWQMTARGSVHDLFSLARNRDRDCDPSVLGGEYMKNPGSHAGSHDGDLKTGSLRRRSIDRRPSGHRHHHPASKEKEKEKEKGGKKGKGFAGRFSRAFMTRSSTLAVDDLHHPPTSTVSDAYYSKTKANANANANAKAAGSPSDSSASRTVEAPAAWRFIGTSSPQVSFKWNSLSTIPTGYRKVIFFDGVEIEVIFPSYLIQSVIRGVPLGLLKGEMGFRDVKHGIEGQVYFGPLKKKAAGGASPLLTRMDSVWGAITSAGSQLGHKLKRGWFSKAVEERQVLYLGASGAERPRCDTYHVGAEQQKPNAIYSVLSGNWLSHLDFDEQRYWTLQESLNQDGHWSRRPEEGGPRKGTRVVPSDSRYRDDLRLLASGDETASQIKKEEMEKLQRHDRACREQGWKDTGRGKMPKYSYKVLQGAKLDDDEEDT